MQELCTPQEGKGELFSSDYKFKDLNRISTIDKQSDVWFNFNTLLNLKRVTTRIISLYLIPFYKKENS